MNIILLEKIKKLGDIGDEVKVKSGYARNFLVPNKKALYATSENKKYFEEKKTEIKSQNDKLIKDAKEKLKTLSGQEVTLIRAASDSGQLFGSVSTKDIVNSLAEKNISILKNEIDLNKSIKNLTYEKVTINLHPEVSCEISLNVARSSEEASTQKKLGKAVTTNSENENNKEEMSKEFSVQDETKTDEKPEKINQAVDLLNEDDKSKESKAPTEKNKASDTDTDTDTDTVG
tara:strand:+ start:341 stop:1036 length:696 start_codon:yes stop_codon:yes gene_type:complete